MCFVCAYFLVWMGCTAIVWPPPGQLGVDAVQQLARHLHLRLRGLMVLWGGAPEWGTGRHTVRVLHRRGNEDT